jgi:hypothetical protein
MVHQVLGQVHYWYFPIRPENTSVAEFINIQVELIVLAFTKTILLKYS